MALWWEEKRLISSVTKGRTQTLNFYRVGAPPGSLIVVDAPGYGARGRQEWGDLFEHYVETRKEWVSMYYFLEYLMSILEQAQTNLRPIQRQTWLEWDGQDHASLIEWAMPNFRWTKSDTTRHYHQSGYPIPWICEASKEDARWHFRSCSDVPACYCYDCVEIPLFRDWGSQEKYCGSMRSGSCRQQSSCILARKIRPFSFDRM